MTVAVLSTGVDARQQDLAGRVTEGPDFSKTGRTQGGPYWGAEGTAVASLIAGHGHGPGGTEGITGVAPGAKILSVQVTLEYNDPLNSDAAVTRNLPAAIAAGIRYAVGHGATVIALPLDPATLEAAPSGDPATGGSAAERAAVSFALAHNVVLVAPAGDNGAATDSVNYPAADPGVISAGATTRTGQLSPFTNTGSYVTLTAPGSGTTPDQAASGGLTADPAFGLMVAAPDGGYEPLASSDMSAALTAGVATLIRSRYPWLTGPQVTQAIEHGVTPPPGAAHAVPAGWGHGALDAGSALTAAAAIAAAHPAPAPPRAGHRGRGGARQPEDQPQGGGRPVRPRPLAPLARRRPRGRRGRADRVPGRRHNVDQAPPPRAGRQVRRRHDGGQAGPPRRPGPARTGPAGRGDHARPRPRRHLAEHAGPARLRGERASRTGPARCRDDRLIPGPRDPRKARRGVPQAAPGGKPALAARGTATRPGGAPGDAPRAAGAGAGPPPLPPWEESPAEFATAPALDDVAPWPISNTGPMYVWNPAASGPIVASGNEEGGKRLAA